LDGSAEVKGDTDGSSGGLDGVNRVSNVTSVGSADVDGDSDCTSDGSSEAKEDLMVAPLMVVMNLKKN